MNQCYAVLKAQLLNKIVKSLSARLHSSQLCLTSVYFGKGVWLHTVHMCGLIPVFECSIVPLSAVKTDSTFVSSSKSVHAWCFEIILITNSYIFGSSKDIGSYVPQRLTTNTLFPWQ